ncbi:MAG TPA: methyltransferase domain-containing protein [Pseudomonadales bacterium]
MSDTKKHWNEIFSTKPDEKLGWYEDDVSQTLKFIREIPLAPTSTIFVSGAGTSTIVEELAKLGCHLILNDISDQALLKLRERIQDDRYEYLLHNMANSLPRTYEIDLWIDRAALHFLLSEEDIATYFRNVKISVKNEGYVLLAEFSKGGATMCAGLEVHQYSLEEMQQRLGEEYVLIASEEYIFVNPYGQDKPYIYGLFQRKKALPVHEKSLEKDCLSVE